jgi:DNA-binding response OmpR family regulator
MSKEQEIKDNIYILIVDDKESMRNLLFQTFHDIGFKLNVASSGEEAIDLLGRYNY